MSILLESMHTPLAFRLYCIFKRFTDLLFLNEYTHMRKCVCLDTRLELSIEEAKYQQFDNNNNNNNNMISKIMSEYRILLA